jgi:hypothetical protein
MVTTQVKAPWVRLTVIALLVAVVGIVIQILSGADYPVVPPGIIMLLVAAAICWFVPWRWAPTLAVVAGVFQLVGTFVAGQTPRMVDFDPVGDSVGLWIQFLAVAVAVAVVAGAVAIVRNQPTRTHPRVTSAR